MVVALTAAAHRDISKQFEQRETRKTYTCLVAGHVSLDTDVIDLPIGKQKSLEGYNRWVIGGEKPRPAQTRYTVDERFTLEGFEYTRVLVEPMSGRGQQIRLHMQALGHALLGDTLHAPDDISDMTPRLCLHATTLAVTVGGGMDGSDAVTTTTPVQASAPSPF
jgi:tRNA pseudouridine32 synthase/23S rRNA pseudouridine746 synthase